MMVGNSIQEALIIHDLGNENEREKRVEELMHEVGLPLIL